MSLELEKFKRLGYFDKLRKELFEAFQNSQQGRHFEQEINTLLSSHKNQVRAYQAKKTMHGQVTYEKTKLQRNLMESVSQ